MQSSGVCRLMVGLLALVLSIGVLPAFAAAQDDEASDIPEGAVDGATRTFSAGSDDFTVFEAFSFIVFEFEDEDAAEAARGEFVDDLLAEVTEDFSDDEGAEYEFEELDELDFADGGRAFTLFIAEEGEGDFAFDIVVVQDAEYLHFWFRFAFSFALEGTPVSEIENVGPDMLIGMAEEWFDGDLEVDDSLLDLLPTEEDLPEGYTLDNEEEGLEALSDDSDDDEFGEDDGTPELDEEEDSGRAA